MVPQTNLASKQWAGTGDYCEKQMTQVFYAVSDPSHFARPARMKKAGRSPPAFTRQTLLSVTDT